MVIKNITTKKDIAYNMLRSAIVKGKLKARGPISVSSISKELNMSAAPIRDALQQLSVEGFITMVPGQGVYINELSFSEAQELYEFMVYLEQIIFKNIINVLTEKDFEDLEAILKKQKELLPSLDYYSYMELNNDFHFYFYKKYYNKTICNYDRLIRDRIFQTSLDSIKKPGRLMQSYQQHVAIVETLKDGNLLRLNQIIETHIYEGLTFALR